MSFAAGRLHVLRGPADGGKSALFRFAGLLEAPTSGEVLVQGQSVRGLTEEARTDLRGQRLGFAFAAPFLLDSFTAIENVAMPLFKISHVGPDEARRRTEAILDFVGLAGAAETHIDDLTPPAQYRLAIARALVNEPTALFVENLDGVLSGQDLTDYTALLRKAATTFGPAIIATASSISHLLPGDRVLHLDEGVITHDAEFLPEPCE